MAEQALKLVLPPIPAKRYFTIGEVSELCGVKPHVLRYWEQEFTQLKPVKRRGNRRYYQHHEVLLIRRIRDLLYEQGFTISGARNRLEGHDEIGSATAIVHSNESQSVGTNDSIPQLHITSETNSNTQILRQGLFEILALLKTS
jgi:DNA-binding transcriptional MerR regulator